MLDFDIYQWLNYNSAPSFLGSVTLLPFVVKLRNNAAQNKSQVFLIFESLCMFFIKITCFLMSQLHIFCLDNCSYLNQLSDDMNVGTSIIFMVTI